MCSGVLPAFTESATTGTYAQQSAGYNEEVLTLAYLHCRADSTRALQTREYNNHFVFTNFHLCGKRTTLARYKNCVCTQYSRKQYGILLYSLICSALIQLGRIQLAPPQYSAYEFVQTGENGPIDLLIGNDFNC